MSIDDVLTKLTAGLARDEAIARAAAERAAEWRSDGQGVDGGPFTPADPEWGITESGEHTIVYDEGWPLAAEAIHIAAQDPRTTLLRVGAIRKVISDYQSAVMHMNWRDVNGDGLYTSDYWRAQALEGALAALASIYAPEETKKQ